MVTLNREGLKVKGPRAVVGRGPGVENEGLGLDILLREGDKEFIALERLFCLRDGGGVKIKDGLGVTFFKSRSGFKIGIKPPVSI